MKSLFLISLMVLTFTSPPLKAASDPWWEYSYEADAPVLDQGNFPPWTLATDQRLAPPLDEATSLEEGIWSQDTGQDPAFCLAWKPAEEVVWRYSSETPVTVEARIKVNPSSQENPDVPVGAIRMAPIEKGLSGRTFYFYFGHNWVALGGSNLGGAQKTSLDTSKFHVYRITIDPTPERVTAELYIDGDPAPVIIQSSGSGEPGVARLLWGDYQYSKTGPMGGSFSLDYLRWSNDKVLAPED